MSAGFARVSGLKGIAGEEKSQMTDSSTGTVGSISPGTAAADFIAALEVEDLDVHSVLVLRHGATVAEAYRAPFDADTPHRMYSVTKSFVSSAVGLAIADGLLTVETRVIDIFPELTPHPVDDHLAALRVKHLLTMSAEHAAFAPPRTSPSVAAYLADRLAVPPGSRFEYSSPSSYVLAAIVQKLTGETLKDYLRPRLFEPLDIAVRHWLRSEEGVDNGGWGLHVTTRELARFGQLYLQKGIWQGRRILPEAWIDEATSNHIVSWANSKATDWMIGYGYQFWRSRHDSYRADGLLGQFCLVFPRLDALVTITAGTLRTQRILDLAWETLLPALESTVESASGDAVPAFPAQPAGAAVSPRAEELSGVTFVFAEAFVLPTRLYGGQAPVISASVELADDAVVLALTDRYATYRLPVGVNAWAGATSPISTGYAEPYKGFASWAAPDRLTIELVFTEAGFRMTFGFELDPLRLTLKTPANPGFEGRTIIGRSFP